MKKLLLVLCVNALFATISYAQNLNRITIKGMAMDTSGADMPFATVMLLNPSDSTLVNFTRADDKGGFHGAQRRQQDQWKSESAQQGAKIIVRQRAF